MTVRTRIKVCCISSEGEARCAIEHGADALGLVGAMPSGPGVIDDALIAEIARSVPPPVATFLLTSETDAGAIADHARRVGTSAVQIVSHIDPAESERLGALLPGVRRVQVVHVEGHDALELVERYAPHAHAFLLDSGRPGEPTPTLGGTGRTHDWDVSAAFVRRSPIPVFLAGGLDDTNVGEAVRRVRPFGVDLCSGVRTDGRLDPPKLDRFVRAVVAA